MPQMLRMWLQTVPLHQKIRAYFSGPCLFGVLHRFQHCTGHITTGSWKGRGNQYIEFARVVYCKLPTNGKQLPAFPLKAVTGIEPPTSEVGGESVTTLPPCSGPYHNLKMRLMKVSPGYSCTHIIHQLLHHKTMRLDDEGRKITYDRFIVGHNLTVTTPVNVVRPQPKPSS